MADLADEYFENEDEVLEELQAERELRARTKESLEGAEFDTIHRTDGRISRRGYVVTEDDIAGVWAEYDEEGHNLETTFYTATREGLVVEDFTDTGWTIPTVKDEARKWLREVRDR